MGSAVNVSACVFPPRSWQADIHTGTCVLAAASVEHAGALCEGIRGEVMACQYLIQTTGLRKTRLTHICRTDSRYCSSERTTAY